MKTGSFKRRKQLLLFGLLFSVLISTGVLFLYKSNNSRDNIVMNMDFQYEVLYDKANIPKSVKADVNSDNKLIITVSIGEIDSLRRQIRLANSAVENNPGSSRIRLEVDILTTDLALRNTQNPRLQLVSKKPVPSGEYEIVVLLTEKAAKPVGNEEPRKQETLSTRITVP